MNKISVQLESGNPYKSGSAIFLNIDDGRRPQLSFNIEDYARVRGAFNEDVAEFTFFTSIIYACDRAIKRDSPGEGDRWTRELVVEIPVKDPQKWNNERDLLESMLEFLTGDIWHLMFINMSIPLFGRDFWVDRRKFRKHNYPNGNIVSLFSGGLDSLIGIIDWLEGNPNSKITLASTYDAQAENAKSDQERLIKKLHQSYPNRIERYVARTGVCSDGEDTNFRSRSLAFIGNAVLASSFIENDVILIPENGAIALNFPLSPAREGSLSTRTVHPKFLLMLNDCLEALGFNFNIRNPYKLKTKGNMLMDCANQTLLKMAYSDSVSCGKRGFDRQYWSNVHAMGCGACVPCIYRQSAILLAGFSEEQYGYDLRNKHSWKRDLLKGNSDLQAIIDFVESNHSPQEIWRRLRGESRLENDLRSDYIFLIQSLKEEVEAWLKYTGLT